MNEIKCSVFGCGARHSFLIDRNKKPWCHDHARKYALLAPSIREAVELYFDLPHWVIDRLDLGVEEIAADLAQARQDGTTDSFADDLTKKGDLGEHVNAGCYYLDKLDRVIEAAGEVTKVERMRCDNCGHVMCAPEMHS